VRAHRVVVLALAVATMGLGVAMLVTTIARGGGPLAFGVVMGVLFVVGGALRLYLLRGGG
jgi:hypothetical protein